MLRKSCFLCAAALLAQAAMRSVDPEGWDAARDTVGAAIYGGKVKKENGASENLPMSFTYTLSCSMPGGLTLSAFFSFLHTTAGNTAVLI
jgi:hypothetical protein